MKRTKEQINQAAYDLLLSLTPGGSEFVNDPERCCEFVKERISFLHRKVIELTKNKKKRYECDIR